MYLTAPQLADLMPDARQMLGDEPEMESTQHYQQLALLVSSLEWRWRNCNDLIIDLLSDSTAGVDRSEKKLWLSGISRGLKV